MAHGTEKGGKRRNEAKMFTTYECPICGEINSKRKSFEVHGARFCKKHGDITSVNRVMDYKAKKTYKKAS